MATQFDLQTPVNVPALASITEAQFLQIVNTLAPLGNIGGVICLSGAGNAHPDITNNPRFVRYVWLDTQTVGSVLIKVYQGVYPSDTYADWATIAVADGSITAAKLANYAVSILNLSAASKIAYKQDASADNTKANYILRLDAAGQFVEIASLSVMVSALTLLPSQLNVAGLADGTILTYRSADGFASFQPISLAGLISNSSIAYQKLVNGTANFILRARPADGVIEAASNDDTISSLFPVGTDTVGLSIAKLTTAGGAAKYGLRYNSTTKVWQFVKTRHVSADTAIVGVTKLITAEAHGLGGIPDYVTVEFVCKGNNAAHGYVIGDVVSHDTARVTTAATNVFIGVRQIQAAFSSYDCICPAPAATTIVIGKADGSGYLSYANISGGAGATYFGNDWNVRVTLGKYDI